MRLVRASGVSPTEQSRFEHNVLSIVLHHLLVHDRLRGSNWVGAVLGGCRFQLLKSTWSTTRRMLKEAEKAANGSSKGRGRGVVAQWTVPSDASAPGSIGMARSAVLLWSSLVFITARCWKQNRAYPDSGEAHIEAETVPQPSSRGNTH